MESVKSRIAKAMLRRLQSVDWPVWLFYALLALVVMGPMLLHGFVLTLDMVFTPKLPAPTELSNNYLYRWLLHLINFVLPGQIIEKFIIFFILVACGVGMHRLMVTKSQFPRYFAGIFYVINPFTYERWMAGQYLVVAGYAILPFLVTALVRFGTEPRKRTATKLLLWYSGLALLSVHVLVLGAIIGIIMFLVYLLAESPRGSYYRDLWRNAGLVMGGAVLLNGYWLYGVLKGTSPIAQTVDSIGSRDLTAFATASGHHGGLFFNVISLYGFWLERFERYTMPNTNRVIWFGGFAILALLIIAGVRWARRQHSLVAMSLGITGLVGLVMALGVDASVSGPVVRAIVEHVPLMKGFRDTQKFSALLALSYAYFAAHGVDWLIGRLKPSQEGRLELLRNAAAILPFVYVSTMPFGFANQLHPVSYPDSWYSFNDTLRVKPPRGKLLFLPWHQYMSYDFVPRVIANPAPRFFTGAEVIAGTNSEFGGQNDPHPTVTSRFIDQQVLAHTDSRQLGRQLAKLDVEYVLLATGYDADHYAWVSQQTDLRLVSKQSGLAVYRNEAYHD